MNILSLAVISTLCVLKTSTATTALQLLSRRLSTNNFQPINTCNAGQTAEYIASGWSNGYPSSNQFGVDVITIGKLECSIINNNWSESFDSTAFECAAYYNSIKLDGRDASQRLTEAVDWALNCCGVSSDGDCQSVGYTAYTSTDFKAAYQNYFKYGLAENTNSITCQAAYTSTCQNEPTAEPTAKPTWEPTARPTAEPTASPTAPTNAPSSRPTLRGNDIIEKEEDPRNELFFILGICGLVAVAALIVLAAKYKQQIEDYFCQIAAEKRDSNAIEKDLELPEGENTMNWLTTEAPEDDQNETNTEQVNNA